MTDRMRGAAVVVAVAALAAVVGFGAFGDGATPPDAVPDPGPEPVEITSSAPTFPDSPAMAAAADLVVVATVGTVSDGRTITDPTDPEVGIRTQLATLVVDEVLQGEPTSPLVLEQEVSLLDGTPVVVDGRAPVEPGDTGTWYLVAGEGDAVPYHALVGPQGLVPAS